MLMSDRQDYRFYATFAEKYVRKSSAKVLKAPKNILFARFGQNFLFRKVKKLQFFFAKKIFGNLYFLSSRITGIIGTSISRIKIGFDSLPGFGSGGEEEKEM